MILGENAKKWQVFTQVSYQGANTKLMPGRHYTSLDAMGLGNPVQSMKRFSAGGHDNTDVKIKLENPNSELL